MDDIPTIHGNIATVLVTVDELIIEVRDIFQPHTAAPAAMPVIDIPAVTPEQVFKEKPVVRVVLTFSSAQALTAQLAAIMPTMAARRKA